MAQMGESFCLKNVALKQEILIGFKKYSSLSGLKLISFFKYYIYIWFQKRQLFFSSFEKAFNHNFSR